MTDLQNQTPAETEPATLPANAINCSCGAWWTGLTRSHCAAPGCHETFSCESAADKHRIGAFGIDRRCAHPVEVGLTARPKAYGLLWGWPASESYDPASKRQPAA
ncbi:FDXHR family putative zinc-binding protein [Streptomyces sp. NPDC054956]